MKPRVYCCTVVKYRVNVETAIFAQLIPKLFSYFTGSLYTFLVFDVQFFKFNYLCQIYFCINYVFSDELIRLVSEIVNNFQT